jgi:hypothetical protein
VCDRVVSSAKAATEITRAKIAAITELLGRCRKGSSPFDSGSIASFPVSSSVVTSLNLPREGIGLLLLILSWGASLSSRSSGKMEW